MKNKSVLYFAVPAFAVLLVIAASALGISNSMMLLALPFTLLGKGLRWLSLSGSAGNLAAIIIYCLVSFMPLLLKLGKKWTRWDWLLVVCCGLLLYVLYYMVNPGLRPVILQNEAGSLALCGAVYAALLCFVVVKLLDRLANGAEEFVFDALKLFLLLGIASLAAGIAVSISQCAASIRQLHEANTVPGQNLFPTEVFLLLSCAGAVLECCLNIRLLQLAGGLVKQVQLDAYSEACLAASRGLSEWCRKSLLLLTFCCAGLNIAQVLLSGALYQVDVNFWLPVFSMGLAFAVMALNHVLYLGKLLKEDNDLFI